MQATIVFSLLLAFSAAVLSLEHVPVTDSTESFRYFRDWAVEYGKSYSSMDEFTARYNIFLDNMKKVSVLNAQRESEDSAHYGATQYADLTDEEFKKSVLYPVKPLPGHVLTGEERGLAFDKPPPKSFDWRNHANVVTPVRDQGKYTTGWAFAGMANMESVYAIKNGKKSEILSTESIVDCVGTACGVNGGNMNSIIQFVEDNKGVMAEKDYPYCVGDDKCSPCAPEGYSPEKCNGSWPIAPCKKEDSCKAKFDTKKILPGFNMTHNYYLKNVSETLIKQELIILGPLMAEIDATDMRFYKGGVLKPNKCTRDTVNHHVLVVGYGPVQNGGEAWIVKNSWGTKWGEQGYFRIELGVRACGIANLLYCVALP